MEAYEVVAYVLLFLTVWFGIQSIIQIRRHKAASKLVKALLFAETAVLLLSAFVYLVFLPVLLRDSDAGHERYLLTTDSVVLGALPSVAQLVLLYAFCSIAFSFAVGVPLALLARFLLVLRAFALTDLVPLLILSVAGVIIGFVIPQAAPTGTTSTLHPCLILHVENSQRVVFAVGEFAYLTVAFFLACTVVYLVLRQKKRGIDSGERLVQAKLVQAQAVVFIIFFLLPTLALSLLSYETLCRVLFLVAGAHAFVALFAMQAILKGAMRRTRSKLKRSNQTVTATLESI